MEKIYINAKFRPVVIVPHLAIRPNFDFWLLSDKDKKGTILYTKDGVEAKVVSCDTYRKKSKSCTMLHHGNTFVFGIRLARVN